MSTGNYVGPQNLANGLDGSNRQSRTGDQVVSQGHGKFHEAAVAGKLFHCDFGVSATGIAISALGTAAGVALYNPVGTGVNLSIISVRLGHVSSTLILGAVMHGGNTNLSAAATTGTAGVVVPGLIGGGAVPVGKPLYTATLPANPTPMRVFAYKQPTIATGNSFILEDLLEGAIAVAPGATWSLYTIASDTTPLWKVSVTWEEVVA